MSAKKILVCGPRPPAFDRESGARRLFDLIALLQQLNAEVTFMALQGAVEERYVSVLAQRGVIVRTRYGSDCQDLLRETKFDAALLAFWHVAEVFMPAIRALSRSTRIIVDSVDLHFLREMRESLADPDGNGNKRFKPEIGARMTRELNVYSQADLVLTVSQKEAALLATFMLEEDRCLVVPDMEDLPFSPLDFHERKNIFFVGNFWHRPNIDAVRFLCEAVVPCLKQETLNRHQITIAGNALDGTIRSMAKDNPGIKMLGWLPSLQAHLSCAKLSIAPLRFGAGTKRKILQSLATGTPIVSTPVGVEGLHLRDEKEVLIAGQPQAFAQGIERLLNNRVLWKRLSKNGRRYVESHHSQNLVRDCLATALEQALTRPALSLRPPPRPLQPEAHVISNPSRVAERHSPGSRSILFSHGLVEERRPRIPRNALISTLRKAAEKKRVLILGVYITERATNIHDIVLSLSRRSSLKVTQRWAALDGGAPTRAVANLTTRKVPQGTPKWDAVAGLMLSSDLRNFDYVVVFDDDVVIPNGFLPAFIGLQERLRFAIAQPARTSRSFIDWPIVEMQKGVLARQTLYVESGPVVSFHRSAFPFVFPFDMTSPMGWGYGNLWSLAVGKRGLKMGIIDATPVDHGLRVPVTGYSRQKATLERQALLSACEHRPYDECFRVTDVLTAGPRPTRRRRRTTNAPAISVLVATYNRSALLEACLESLKSQTLPKDVFEVIVVDDGSVDDTPVTVKRHSDLPIRYFRLNHAGKAAAKNLALFASMGKIVLFFDDDDVAGRDLLQEHLTAHAKHTEESVAILGYTTWSDALEKTPVMNYITSVGKNLFSYGSFNETETLGFTYFWEGRLSCKRSFLATRAIHNQDLEYLVDIELGYRLSRNGLAIVYHPRAISYMNRPLSFREFCERCEAKGRALQQLWQLHGTDSRIREYCAPSTHQSVCAEFESNSEAAASRVRKLEHQWRELRSSKVLRELHDLYRAAFAGFLSKGFIAAKRSAG